MKQRHRWVRFPPYLAGALLFISFVLLVSGAFSRFGCHGPLNNLLKFNHYKDVLKEVRENVDSGNGALLDKINYIQAFLANEADSFVTAETLGSSEEELTTLKQKVNRGLARKHLTEALQYSRSGEWSGMLTCIEKADGCLLAAGDPPVVSAYKQTLIERCRFNMALDKWAAIQNRADDPDFHAKYRYEKLVDFILEHQIDASAVEESSGKSFSMIGDLIKENRKARAKRLVGLLNQFAENPEIDLSVRIKETQKTIASMGFKPDEVGLTEAALKELKTRHKQIKALTQARERFMRMKNIRAFAVMIDFYFEEGKRVDPEKVFRDHNEYIQARLKEAGKVPADIGMYDWKLQEIRAQYDKALDTHRRLHGYLP